MSSDTASGWHVDAESLRRWVDGDAGPLVSASVEQHVLRCAHCRAEVADLVPAAAVPSWDAVLTAVEVPRPSPVERLVSRLGLSPSDSLVLASAPTLRAPWLLGTVGVLLFALLASMLAGTDGPGPFLLVAPLIPVVGVAAAYGPMADPSYEAVLVTPYGMIRLVLLRTVSVLVTSVPLVVAAGLVMPAPALVAVAWLLPAAVCIAVVLTASNWIEPAYAATVVALGWVATVAAAVRTGDALAVFSPIALTGYVTVLAVAVLMLLHRLLNRTPSWRLR